MVIFDPQGWDKFNASVSSRWQKILQQRREFPGEVALLPRIHGAGVGVGDWWQRVGTSSQVESEGHWPPESVPGRAQPFGGMEVCPGKLSQQVLFEISGNLEKSCKKCTKNNISRFSCLHSAAFSHRLHSLSIHMHMCAGAHVHTHAQNVYFWAGWEQVKTSWLFLQTLHGLVRPV